MLEQATVEVELDDGRKFVLRELTGFDEMIAKKLINFKGIGDMAIIPEVLLVFSIASVNGKPFSRPTNMAGIQAVMSELRGRDVRKLQKVYAKLTGEDDEGEAEAPGLQA